MVIQAFPAAKLGLLLLKHISKPISDFIKTTAKNSELFKSYVCIPPARLYNWIEFKSRMWIRLGQAGNVPPLNDQVAIDLGANLLGEMVIFTTAANIIITEYNRSAHEESLKELAKREEIRDLQNRARELFIKKDEQAAEIRDITRRILVLEDKMNERSRINIEN